MRQRRGLRLLLVGLIILIAELLSITGVTIIPLGFVVLALSAGLLVGRIGWTLSLVGSLVTLLAVEVFLLRLLPLTTLDLATSHELFWGIAAVGLGLVSTTRQNGIPKPSRQSVRTAIRASAAAVVVGIVVAVIAIVSRSTVVSWSMNNDAAWTTFQAQHIAADRGINTAAHPNPSAFMSGLMAVVDSPGRSNLSSARWLESDIIRNGQLWVLVILGTSILVGLLVSRAIGPHRPRFRAVATVLVSLIPFSWYFSGFSIVYGFYSASLAIVLVLGVWALWQGAREHPLWAFTFFGLLATDVLATWAPLVLVPVAAAIVVFGRHIRLFVRPPSSVGVIVAALSVVQLVGYGLFVAVPDLHSNESALSAIGAIQNVPPWVFILTAVATLFIAFAEGALGAGFYDVVGVLAIESAMAAATLVVLLQGGAGWSYYPDKIAWLSTILLFVVMACSLGRLLGQPRGNRGGSRALILASAVVSLAAVGITAVVVRPIGASPLAVSPLSSEVASVSRTRDALAHRVFTFADPAHKTLLSRYSSAAEDAYVNFWLLQLTAQGGTDRIRYFAYSFDSTNATAVCAAIAAWHADVRVLTSSPGWADALHSACPHAAFTTIVKRP